MVSSDLILEPGNEIYQHVPEHEKDNGFDYINEEGFFRDLKPLEGSVWSSEEISRKNAMFILYLLLWIPQLSL